MRSDGLFGRILTFVLSSLLLSAFLIIFFLKKPEVLDQGSIIFCSIFSTYLFFISSSFRLSYFYLKKRGLFNNDSKSDALQNRLYWGGELFILVLFIFAPIFGLIYYFLPPEEKKKSNDGIENKINKIKMRKNCYSLFIFDGVGFILVGCLLLEGISPENDNLKGFILLLLIGLFFIGFYFLLSSICNNKIYKIINKNTLNK